MKVSRSFIETLVNYVNCVSKDDTRVFLQGVCIQYNSADDVKMIATDGFKSIDSIHTVEDNEKDFENLIIHKDDIKTLKNILSNNKDVNQFCITIVDNNVNFYKKVSNTEDQLLCSFQGINREYPNIERVKPVKFQEQETICFNPDFITDLRKAIYGGRKTKYGSPKLKFRFSGQSNPLLAQVNHEGIEHTCLLMPIRD